MLRQNSPSSASVSPFTVSGEPVLGSFRGNLRGRFSRSAAALRKPSRDLEGDPSVLLPQQLPSCFSDSEDRNELVPGIFSKPPKFSSVKRQLLNYPLGSSFSSSLFSVPSGCFALPERDFVHLSVDLLAIHISNLEKCLFGSFAHF